jgi:hypothetical protein
LSSECANGPRSRVRIGQAEVSRFIIGHNPPCGCSHVTKELDGEMREYFTQENVLGLYRQAEAAGLRTILIRGDYRMLEWVEQFRRKGGTLDVVSQTASEMHDVFVNIRVLAAAGVKAVYHHGSRTDRFWREGRIEKARDYLRCMRDCGVAVGLGTHEPNVVDYVQQHDWDVDFYMACFYNLSRRPRESSIVSGRSTYELEEYLPEDRDRMCAVIRSADKPCLGYKILAAGRNCATPDDTREAFRYAYANIKPGDAVVVGLFPKYEDQLALDLSCAEEACRAAHAT